MNILILGSQKTVDLYPDYYELYEQFVRDSLPAEGEHTIDVTFLDDLIIELSNDACKIIICENEKAMSEYDMVFARGVRFRPFLDVLKVVSEYCREHGILMVNDYEGGRSGSKIAQAIQFYSHQLPIPYTLYINRGSIQKLDDLPLEFPMIMKAVLGTRGENNFLVQSRDDIRGHFRDNPDLNFVLQNAIPNDGDYRLLIIGDDAELIHRKAVGDSHLNNTSQGGTATLRDVSPIPSELLERIHGYLKAYGLITAGVDILQDSSTGEWYLLEVNSQPQLTTGAYLPEKVALFAKYLAKLNDAQSS